MNRKKYKEGSLRNIYNVNVLQRVLEEILKGDAIYVRKDGSILDCRGKIW